MKISEVSTYLKQIGATADEINSCIMCVAGQPGSWRKSGRRSRPVAEDLDSLRTWVANENPELLGRATGKALTTLYKVPYPELADLALRYHQTTRDDALLIPLLENRKAEKNPELARSLAENLSDETLRNKYMEKFK